MTQDDSSTHVGDEVPPPGSDEDTSRLLDPQAPRQETLDRLEAILSRLATDRRNQLLQRLLKTQRDPAILSKVLESLEPENNLDLALAIRPMLVHEDVRVVRLAMVRVLTVDPESGARWVTDRIRSKRTRVRDAAIESLIKAARPEAIEVLDHLAHQEREQDRRIALAHLQTISTERAWPILLGMFERETEVALVEELARYLPEILPESGIEPIYGMRERLHQILESPVSREFDGMTIHKLDLTGAMLGELFQRFHFLPIEIEKFETRYRQRVESALGGPLTVPDAGDPRTATALKVRARRVATGWSLRLGRWGPRIVLAFLLIAGFTLLARVSHHGEQTEGQHAGFSFRHGANHETSRLGKSGDPLYLDGEIVHVDPGRKFIIVMKNRALGLKILLSPTQRKLLFRGGQEIHVEGQISRVVDERNVEVEAYSLATGPRMR